MPKPDKRERFRAVPANAAPSTPSCSETPPARVWIFRLVALALFPALAFALLECGLWTGGYGNPTTFFLSAQRGGQAVCIENPEFGNRFFPPGLARQPQPLVFEQCKPPGTKRIFVLGESAAMGDPVPAFGMARVMEVLLRERFKDVRWEIINVGMTAINSHVILPIAQECAAHEGDAWVIYMGNNEVVGPFGGGTVFGRQAPPRFMIRLNLALKATRTGQFFASLLGRFGTSTPPKWAGMEMFLNQQVAKDDPRMARVYSHLEANLREIERLGQSSGAKVIVSSPAANLKDCAPFASKHQAGLRPQDLAAWELEFTRGIEFQRSNQINQALDCYQRALQIDPAFADLWFRLGQCQAALSQSPSPLPAFKQALELDTLRFRPDDRISKIIRESARDSGSPYVDSTAVLSEHAPIPGDDLMYDHVHPSFEGSYWIGRRLAEQVAMALPGLKAQADWLSMEQCGKRLALTAFDQSHTLDIVINRMLQPPFTQQSNHGERLAQCRAKAALCRTQAADFPVQTSLYEEQLRAHPEDWVIRVNYAKLLEASGQPRKALDQWREAQSALPWNPEIACAIGNSLDRLGKSSEAAPYFREAIRLCPALAGPLNDLGLCLEHQGKTSEAVTLYQKAIALEPQMIEAHVNLGAALAELGKYEDARTEFDNAFTIRSNSPSAHLALGKCLAKQGRSQEALVHFQTAVAAGPDDPIAHYTLGNAFSSLGRATDAMDQWTLAATLAPDMTEARLKLALELASQGKKSEAHRQFEEAVRRSPNNVDAQFNLAISLAQQRRWTEAIEHFEAVLRLDPSNVQARKNLEAAVGFRNGAR